MTETKEALKNKSEEKMTVLGSRVFKKHRKMLRVLSKHKTKEEGEKVTEGEIVRRSIETFYEKEKPSGVTI